MSKLSVRPLRLFQLTSILFVGLMAWIFRQECLQSEDLGQTCLSQAATPVARILSFGSYILNRYGNYLDYEVCTVGCIIAIVLLTLIVRWRCSWWAFLYLAGLSLAVMGEYSALKRIPTATLWYHIGACAAVFGAFTVLLKRLPDLLSQGWLEAKRVTARVTVGEVLGVLSLLALACVTRFYQLNRNPSAYDGEACPHRMIASSWKRILEQEIGEHVQQSPGISWAVLHRLFTRLDHPTLFYLDERIMTAGISLLGCLVMYFFVRNLRGPFAAFTAVILYTFGPLDLEWSRLPTMHHVPVVLALLLAWAAFSALSSRSWISFTALALLIACTKFVYPSAKLALFGPVGALFCILMFQRREWRGHYLKLLSIVAGVALFICLRSLAYYLVRDRFMFIPPFDNPYPSHLEVSQFERIQKMLKEGVHFFYEIFYAPVEPTHWTNHAMLTPIRSLSSITVVFTGLAFTRLLFLLKKPEALVFIGMILGGLIPGMATQLADRRVAVSLALCIVLGVLELSWFLDVVVARGSKVVAALCKWVLPVCLLICVGVSQTMAFFTRFNNRPIQADIGEKALQLVKDNTLVVYLADERRCEMFYSLYTKMLDPQRSIAYTAAYEGSSGIEALIKNPAPVLSSWYYAHTDLASQIEALSQRKQWDNYMFVFQLRADRESWRALLRQTYPQGTETIEAYTPTREIQMLFYEVSVAASQSLPPAIP